MKVYLAGSSQDMERCRAWYERLKRCGIEVVSTWIQAIEKVGAANPDMSKDTRHHFAETDLSELRSASLVWFLVPPPDKATRGAWFELGFAYTGGAVLIASGDTKQSIFTALAMEFEDDVDAFIEILCQRALRA